MKVFIVVFCIVFYIKFYKKFVGKVNFGKYFIDDIIFIIL